MIGFLKIGAGHAIVVEPMTITRVYPAQWSKATIDLTELARLRFEEKWPIKRIQEHFGLCSTKIKKELRKVRPANSRRFRGVL